MPIRRTEFAVASPALAEEILSGARYGHLASVGPAGAPELRPLNYVAVGSDIYFHTSPYGDLNGWAGRQACFCVEDTLCWLPSHWRHSELACPASTYYRSLLVRGRLTAVTELESKGLVLQAFMERYQPEGRHRPLTEPIYHGPLEALTVLALPLQELSCKVKLGQHLTPDLQRAMVAALVERGAPGDLACAQAMRRHNQMESEEGWTFDPTRLDPAEIWRLLAPTYWGHRRTREGVEEQRDQAWLVLGRVGQGRLEAYARLQRVDSRTGFLYDVIVDETARGRGWGKEVMLRLLAHPKVGEVERIFLDTRDAMAFYELFGFRSIAVNNSGSTTMLWERG